MALFAIMAEFTTPGDLLRAARLSRDQGYREMDAFTPYRIPGLAEFLGDRRRELPLLALAGGVAGSTVAFLFQYWVAVIDLPSLAGGKPLNSWIAFIPITFECGVLGAALALVGSMFVLNGLPRPHHPVFSAPRFHLASRDRFFLSIEARDARFERDEVRRFLESMNAVEVVELES